MRRFLPVLLALLLCASAQAAPVTPTSQTPYCSGNLNIATGYSNGGLGDHDTFKVYRSTRTTGPAWGSYSLLDTFSNTGEVQNKLDTGGNVQPNVEYRYRWTTSLLGIPSAPSFGSYCNAGAHYRYPLRGIYDRDLAAQIGLGFNLIDSSTDPTLVNQIGAAGGKALVWLGGYSNTTCTWANDDAWITSHVGPLNGNVNVGALFIDDEPNTAACPSFPSQLQARQNLIKGLAPGPPTLVVTYRTAARDPNDDQLAQIAGKVDVVGLDWYPCNHVNGCDFTRIEKQAAAADALGVRYWAVMEVFEDGYYSMPTPSEIHQQFLHWRGTNMESYLIYAWASGTAPYLRDSTDQKNQLALENAP